MIELYKFPHYSNKFMIKNPTLFLESECSSSGLRITIHWISLFLLNDRQFQHLICTSARGQVYPHMSDVHTAGHEIIPPVP